MKICVVEDEEVWRNKIQEIIEKYCIDKNILFQIQLCSNVIYLRCNYTQLGMDNYYYR